MIMIEDILEIRAFWRWPALLGAISVFSGLFVSNLFLGYIGGPFFEEYGLNYAWWVYMDQLGVPLSAEMGQLESNLSITEMRDLPDTTNILSVWAGFLLSGAGFAAASWRSSVSLSKSMIEGALITPGTLLSSVMISLFTYQSNALDSGIGSDVIQTAIYGGLLYPVIFGAVGGLIYFIATRKFKLKNRQS